MISERQRKIIKFLQNDSLSVHEIANKLKVSSRTISREIKAINNEMDGVAQITNDGTYHLNIKSSIGLYKLLGQGIPDEIEFLYLLLTKKDLSLDDLAEQLYLPKSKIKEYISKINREYKKLFKIDLKQGTGLVFDIPIFLKVDIMSNLLLDYPALIEDDFSDKKINNVDSSAYKNNARRYIDSDEIKDQIISSQILLDKNDCKLFFENKLSLLNKISSEEDDISNNIIQVFLDNGFQIPTTSILNMLINHIKHETLFPTIILKNQSDIRIYLKEQPVAFDLARKISNHLREKYTVNINTYYLSLYFMLALSTFDDSIYKIVLVSRRRSISSINKYLIEEEIKGSQVYIVDSIKNLDHVANNFAVVLDSELIDGTTTSHKVDMVITSLMTDQNINKLRKIVRNKAFSKLLKDVNTKHSFKIKNYDSDFFTTFDSFLDTLLAQKCINEIEKAALLNREKAGNQLVIKNYSLPHIISGRKGNFRLFKADLRTPVVVNQQFVDKILIVIIGTSVSNKSEIFKYLFNVISNEAN